MDFIRASLLRRCMRGKASGKQTLPDGTIKYRGLTLFEILQFWKLCPARLDNLVRRLRWYQSWARDPQGHAQIICAVLGKMRCEATETLDAEGRVAAGANPWLLQMMKDLQEFAEGDDAAADLLADIDGRPVQLFVNEESRQEFLKLDASIL